MGRFLEILLGVLALVLLVVPAAGAAPDPAALAAELPTPSCAEGPERDGEVIVGTPCESEGQSAPIWTQVPNFEQTSPFAQPSPVSALQATHVCAR